MAAWQSEQPHQPIAEPQAQAYRNAPKTVPSTLYSELAVDDGEVPLYRRQTTRQKYFGGIGRTLSAFATVAFIVLVINVSWLIYAKFKYKIENGFGTISRTKCDAVKSTNTWLHFLINILSTLLLTGSNTFMATFCCPSREEVDRAHQRHRWLHVGSFSWSNLRGIARRKAFVVVLLACTSIPFHLLYNSLVFSSLSGNEYYYSIVTEDFLTGAPFNLTGDWQPRSMGDRKTGMIPKFDKTQSPPNGARIDPFDATLAVERLQTMVDYYSDMQKAASTWERLENKECIQAYSDAFVSSRRNVLLISRSESLDNSVLYWGASDMNHEMTNNWWICSKTKNDGGADSCSPDTLASSASTWEVFDFPISYCLSETVDSVCSVQFSEKIMYVVIAFNVIKVLAMLWILFRYDAENILISVGDAMASFLKFQDPTTTSMCLADKRHISSFWKSRGLAKQFSKIGNFWGTAVSRKRWILFFFFMMCSFLLFLVFGAWGFKHAKDRGVNLNLKSLWKLGLGRTSQNTMVLYGGGGNPDSTAIIANLPQVILALVSFVFMSIMSSLFLAEDWSKFAFMSQSLMVSSPVGIQRGTWLLGAPLGWGSALLILQTLLHWLLSQSIFVVQISIFNKDGTPVPDNASDDESTGRYAHLSNCGYSPIAIILSVIAAAILFLFAMVFYFRRFPPGSPPVVSTCSAAISAACHPISMSEEKMYGKFRWGADGGTSDGVGHCSIISDEVWRQGYAQAPGEGCLYV
ncbi:hypothetical protein VTL71DRAFT_14866 [Oculimacula yallundae]|uniref:DUF6536 domain-containing protein n=1 Tax=Oculimacula yallundae TaxID=86028 RepID=A0ABR4CEZ5_9HELO